MLDRDLAELYGGNDVPPERTGKTKPQAVSEDTYVPADKRGKKQALIDGRKPLNTLKFSPALPNVFTEHGAVMLASVLNN